MSDYCPDCGCKHGCLCGDETPPTKAESELAPETLLAGVEQLTKPDFHKLNVHAGRNDRLLHAVLCAYAKHHLDCDDIGWNELGDILHDAICNEIGDDKYCAWADLIKKD